jgi:hypothetical protein
MLGGQATLFLSCSEKFKEQVARPLRELLAVRGIRGIIVSDEPVLPRTSEAPDSKIDSYLDASDAFVAVCTPDDHLSDGTIQCRQNIVDEIQRAHAKSHLRERIQVLKEPTVVLHSNINPTYEDLDLKDIEAAAELVLTQLDAWNVLGPTKADPLIRDFKTIVAEGLHDLSAEKLTTLPTLLGPEGKPAEGVEIRDAVMDLLMDDEPGKKPTDFDALTLSTRFGLTLFGATPETRMLTAADRRKMAHRIYCGVSAEAIRNRPSAKQLSGDPELSLLVRMQERLLEKRAGAPAPTAPSAVDVCAEDGPVAAQPVDIVPGTSLAEAFFIEGYVYNSVRFREALKSCQSLSLLGFSHNRMAVTYASELSRLMERGGRLRVLALDPGKPIVLDANLRSYVPKQPDVVRHQHEAAIATLTAIGERASSPESFELRLMDCTPPYTIYLFDEDDDTVAQAFVWLTPWRMPSPERPGFCLSGDVDGAWYHFFADQLTAMWKNFEGPS